jgi:hypothetical protein
MKHLNFRLCTIICSLLILSFNVQAATEEAQELFAETLVQCASCSCMVATSQDTTRGTALCGCCQSTEDSRALGCSCELASVAQLCQSCRSCCSLQKRSNLLESNMVQCSLCNCMVPKPEASTKSPALCNCHQQDTEGRASFCACDQGATLSDCDGCSSKKKANE